ncbi:MAG: peroxiredoxin-like family protein [Methyloceanibacter sp.]|uniref:peroxiredoxin-like family protein n=1 Tax=Methyloceanibacter sp. TaxID=1965321 RepID=UPI003D6C906B
MGQLAFATVEEAFAYCRDMDASLSERLEMFADAARQLTPALQVAVDRMVDRLKAHEAGAAAPGPGDSMPPFALPDETGRVIALNSLLATGPVAITFHRGHWCPYCRINTRVLSDVQQAIAAEGASIVAIVPERQQFAAALKADAALRYPVLSDVDNGYALSIGLAIWVGAEVQELMAKSGRDLPAYQGNDAWILPIPATFVIGQDGRVAARFIDPDYRRRMAVEDLLAGLREARDRGLPN